MCQHDRSLEHSPCRAAHCAQGHAKLSREAWARRRAAAQGIARAEPAAQLAWLAEHQAEGDRAGGPRMADLAGDHPVHRGYILGLLLNRVEQEGDRAGGPRMADLAGDHPVHRGYLLGLPLNRVGARGRQGGRAAHGGPGRRPPFVWSVSLRVSLLAFPRQNGSGRTSWRGHVAGVTFYD